MPNAPAWTDAVRSGAIASRRRGTDAAMVAACAVRPGERVWDVGCGEGWLSRALAGGGAQVTGTDGSAPLVDAARASGGAHFEVATYADLVAEATRVPGPFDLIAVNFAILDEVIGPFLVALRQRLAPGGRMVIQTVHPFVAAGDAGYVAGWREERFAGFGDGFSAPMPWYFRPLDMWWRQLANAGWRVDELREPRDSDGAVLSLILACVDGTP